MAVPAAQAVVNGTLVTAQEKIAASAVLIVCLRTTATTTSIVGSATGVIVGPQFLLTAAHTFSMCQHGRGKDDAADYTWELRFGLDGLAASRVALAFTPAELLNAESHQLMAQLHIDHQTFKDYVYVRIPGGLPPGYRPMRVATDPALLRSGMWVYFSGYGFTAARSNDYRLRTARTKVTSTDPSRPGMAPLDPDLNAFDRQFYLDFYDSLQHPCHGDSGGPFYVIEQGQPLLVGMLTHLQTYPQPRPYCDASAIGLRTDAFSAEMQRIERSFRE